ncbi:MAG: VOC family protein [Calditrichaeota bacterium]|nr:MAG: VOC family protein [Calditrichota bacterium]
MTDFNSEKNRAVWFDMPVADLDRASDFYSAVLDIKVSKEKFGDIEFAILDHQDGNGGCLVVDKKNISANTGILLYLNVNNRIKDAVSKVSEQGGSIVDDIHAIGPHGFRAIILDSEGNRIALHSNTEN